MTLDELITKHKQVFDSLGARGPIMATLLGDVAGYIAHHRLTDAEVRLFANMLVECSTVADNPES